MLDPICRSARGGADTTSQPKLRREQNTSRRRGRGKTDDCQAIKPTEFGQWMQPISPPPAQGQSSPHSLTWTSRNQTRATHPRRTPRDTKSFLFSLCFFVHFVDVFFLPNVQEAHMSGTMERLGTIGSRATAPGEHTCSGHATEKAISELPRSSQRS